MDKIIICADDFGQNQPISMGILKLIQLNRLSAVSCITNTSAWPESAKKISLQNKNISLGLHFNLTLGTALTSNLNFSSLFTLLSQSYTKKLSKGMIETEFEAQLDNFIAHTGNEPDFIDGHQHIQQFPIIRDAILAVYIRRFHRVKPYIRISAANSLSGFPKALIINLLGSTTLKKLCQQLQIPHNTSFSGIYNFKFAKNYRNYFKRFLSETTSGGLIMCHPGLVSNDKEDEQRMARQFEYNYFTSEDYISDLQAANKQI